MVVVPEEAAEGTWWSNSASSSSGRQRRVVGAGRAATAAAAAVAEAGIDVTKDGHSTTRSRRYDFAAAGKGAVVAEDGTSTHEVPPRRKATAVEEGVVVTEDGSSTHEFPPHRKAAAVEDGVVVTEDGSSTHEFSPHRKAAAVEAAVEEGVVVTEDGSSTHEFSPHRVTNKYGKKTTKPSLAVLSSGEEREKLPYCDANDRGKARICHKGDEEKPEKCPGYPTDMQRGMCDTSGIYDHVLPFLNHQEVIPGRIYYGLDFKDDPYKDNGMTYTPHDPPMSGPQEGIECFWGGGKSVGRCIRDGYKPKHADVFCPSTQRHIVDGWQRCAEMCNDQPDCHTFTVSTNRVLNHLDFKCHFYKSYECQSNPAGIKNYVKREDIREDKYDTLGVWSGICRTRSGRTSDYACTKTPIPPLSGCANIGDDVYDPTKFSKVPATCCTGADAVLQDGKYLCPCHKMNICYGCALSGFDVYDPTQFSKVPASCCTGAAAVKQDGKFLCP